MLLFSVRNALYRSVETSLILCLGNGCHTEFLLFLCCWSSIFAAMFSSGNSSGSQGRLITWQISSFFAPTCLRLKSLLHTISLNIYLFIFNILLSFPRKSNLCETKIPSCAASGAIKPERVEKRVLHHYLVAYEVICMSAKEAENATVLLWVIQWNK